MPQVPHLPPWPLHLPPHPAAVGGVPDKLTEPLQEKMERLLEGEEHQGRRRRQREDEEQDAARQRALKRLEHERKKKAAALPELEQRVGKVGLGLGRSCGPVRVAGGRAPDGAASRRRAPCQGLVPTCCAAAGGCRRSGIF